MLKKKLALKSAILRLKLKVLLPKRRQQLLLNFQVLVLLRNNLKARLLLVKTRWVTTWSYLKKKLQIQDKRAM